MPIPLLSLKQCVLFPDCKDAYPRRRKLTWHSLGGAVLATPIVFLFCFVFYFGKLERLRCAPPMSPTVINTGKEHPLGIYFLCPTLWQVYSFIHLFRNLMVMVMVLVLCCRGCWTGGTFDWPSIIIPLSLPRPGLRMITELNLVWWDLQACPLSFQETFLKNGYKGSLLGWWKCFRTWYRTTLKVLNATDLYNSKWLILLCEFHKKKKQKNGCQGGGFAFLAFSFLFFFFFKTPIVLEHLLLFFFFNLLFIFGCVGSSFLREGFL